MADQVLRDKDNSEMLALSLTSGLAREIGSSKKSECPYVLFLGAGASVTSGIPATAGLINEWKFEAYCGVKGIKYPIDRKLKSSTSILDNYVAWETSEYEKWRDRAINFSDDGSEYSQLFEFFRQSKETRQTFIEDLITEDHVKPSPGYVYLAGLMYEAIIGCVLTTNFDDLVSEALSRFFYQRPIVCAFESSINNFNNSSTRPKIIKLHGDYLFNDIRNTDSELVALDVNMENKMIELCQDRGLVFVGYGGMDESIMEPILKQMHVNPRFLTKDLHWCILKNNREPSSEGEISMAELPEKLRKLKRRFPKRVHIYEIDGFDNLFSDIFDHAGLTIESCLEKAKGRSVASSFREAVEVLKVGSKLTKRMVEDKSIAAEFLNEKVSELQSNIDRADAKWELGTYSRDKEHEYEQAIESYEAGLVILSNLDELPEISNSHLLKILRRRMGCEIGRAKCYFMLEQENETSLAFKNFSLLAEKVERQYEEDKVSQLEKSIFSSCFFNMICGYCAWITRSDNEFEDFKKHIRLLIQELKQLPDGREKIDKLLEPDEDVEPYFAEIEKMMKMGTEKG